MIRLTILTGALICFGVSAYAAPGSCEQSIAPCTCDDPQKQIQLCDPRRRPGEELDRPLLAQQGHGPSQCIMGVMNHCAVSMPENIEAALEWYAKAAENDNALAKEILGQIYMFGQDVPRDLDKAYYYLKDAGVSRCVSVSGNALIAEELADIGIPAEAKDIYGWLQDRAAEENGAAHYLLYLVHSQSNALWNKTLKDKNKAAYWLKKAAENSHPLAATNIALDYRYGSDGEAPNPGAALRFYEIVASQPGCGKIDPTATAQVDFQWQDSAGHWHTTKVRPHLCSPQSYIAGIHYYDLEDPQAALPWAEKSNWQNDIYDRQILAMTYFKLGEYEKALPHFLELAKHDDYEAQYYAGYSYYKGLGAQKNYAKAAELLYTSLSYDQIASEIYDPDHIEMLTTYIWQHQEGMWAPKDIGMAYFYAKLLQDLTQQIEQPVQGWDTFRQQVAARGLDGMEDHVSIVQEQLSEQELEAVNQLYLEFMNYHENR